MGAGTGATVGKIFGMKQAMKSGIGSFTVTLPGGVLVASLVAVNAFGDVRDPDTGKIVAGARKAPDSREFADTVEQMKRGELGRLRSGSNTTLAVVATNARLTKVQANKLAQFASLGMARTIYPVNTMADGDTAFALSIGRPRGRYQRAGRGGGRSAGRGHRARGEAREDAGRRAGAGVGRAILQAPRQVGCG